MGKRRKARELALQFLYQFDINPPNMRKPDSSESLLRHVPDNLDALSSEDVERELNNFWENFKTDEEVKPFFIELVRGVLTHKTEIDQIINKTSENWKLERMAVVDRNILRFSIFELLYRDDIPPNVTMNEAIEIAKRYGSDESHAFINGILDKVAILYNKKTDSGNDR